MVAFFVSASINGHHAKLDFGEVLFGKEILVSFNMFLQWIFLNTK